MDKNRTQKSHQNLIPLAIFAYYLAEHVGGNGFIAAFFAGLYLGNYNDDLREHVENFAESEGELLILISFIMFGISFVPQYLPYWNWTTLAYAILSLTVIRMLPVALSLLGSRLDLSTKLFMGWFGPRALHPSSMF